MSVITVQNRSLFKSKVEQLVRNYFSRVRVFIAYTDVPNDEMERRKFFNQKR